MLPIETFDAVHVISDLHLGGRPGFQIFGLRQELKGLIEFLADLPADQSIALVVNGDFIDFLAEEPASYFDPLGAGDKLAQILEKSFAEIRDALKKFIGRPGRRLIVNVGNHDMELALPWVRERLYHMLADNDPAARSRMVVATEGTGIRCRVGSADILCVHGNEVDTWNVTDHETIRRIARDLVHGKRLEPWIPNAGTQLVIDVMNEVKRTYAFVDVLKPEVDGVIPTLFALDSQMVGRFLKAGPIGSRFGLDWVRRKLGFLEAGPMDDAGTPSAPGPRRGDAMPAGATRAERATLAQALLDRTEQQLGAGQEPMDLIDPGGEDGYLGKFGALTNLVKGDVVEALREALEGLEKDRSFALRDADATFQSLDATIGRDVDFLLAGHTHLERALPRRAGAGFYFNTGTWARLIQLEPAVLRDPDRFRQAFQTFKGGQMEALDQSGLVRKRPTFASLWVEGHRTQAELRRFDATARPPFVPVVDTRFARG